MRMKLRVLASPLQIGIILAIKRSRNCICQLPLKHLVIWGSDNWDVFFICSTWKSSNSRSPDLSQTRDYRMLMLISDLIKMRQRGACDDELLAIIAAYEADFDKMEAHLRKANKLELGVQIYTELRMFDRARSCLQVRVISR